MAGWPTWRLWLGEVAGALDVTLEDVLPSATQDELLTLTGDIAHNVVRLAVPLSSYLIGVAVGRGASAEEAIRIVGGLLPAADGSGRGQSGKRYLVWVYGALPKARIFAGVTPKTSPVRPAPSRNPSSVTS